MVQEDLRRKDLTQFSKEEIGVAELTTKNPSCSCETAESPEGSPGPVLDNETLRFFVTSRSDVDLKRRPNLASTRPFKAISLKKAYDKGLSVCRMEHASEDEIARTARILHENQTARNGEFGGVIAVIDFPTHAVRNSPDGVVPMCVYETPLEPEEIGNYSRPSHADIVISCEKQSDLERKQNREIIFNQIMNNSTNTFVENIGKPNLNQFLPKIMQNP